MINNMNREETLEQIEEFLQLDLIGYRKIGKTNTRLYKDKIENLTNKQLLQEILNSITIIDDRRLKPCETKNYNSFIDELIERGYTRSIIVDYLIEKRSWKYQ